MLSSAFRIRFSRSRLGHNVSLLLLAVEATIYLSKAERGAARTNPLHCTGSIWPAACCKPLQCSNDVGKNNGDPLLAKHHRDKVSNIFISLSCFPLYEVIIKPKGKYRASYTERKYPIKNLIPYNALLSHPDTVNIF